VGLGPDADELSDEEEALEQERVSYRERDPVEAHHVRLG
jgi:hypothetical protein